MSEEELARLRELARSRRDDPASWESYMTAAQRVGRERLAVRDLRVGLDRTAQGHPMRGLYLRWRFRLDGVLGDPGFPLAAEVDAASLPGRFGMGEPMALAPGGGRLARAVSGSEVELRSGLTGEVEEAFAVEGWITHLAFSGDGRRLGILLSLEGEEPRRVFEVRPLVPPGPPVRHGPFPGTVMAFHLAPLRLLQVPDHGLAPGEMLVQAPPSWIVSPGEDQERVRLRLPSGVNHVVGAAFSPCGDLLAAATPGGLDLYDCAGGELVRPMRTGDAYHPDRTCRLAWSPDGARLAITMAGGRLRIFDAASGSEQGSAPGPRGALRRVFWTAGAQVVVHVDNRLEGYEGADAQVGGTWELSSGTDAVATAASPDGELLLVRRGDRLELAAGGPYTGFAAALGHRAPVRTLAVTEAGDHVLSLDEDGDAISWHLESGEPRWRRGVTSDPLRTHLGPHGLLLEVGDTARLHDPATGEGGAELDLRPLLRAEGRRSTLRGLALSPSGKRLLFTDSAQRMRLCEFPTGEVLFRHESAWAEIEGCGFGDEDLLVLAGVPEQSHNPILHSIQLGPPGIAFYRPPGAPPVHGFTGPLARLEGREVPEVHPLGKGRYLVFTGVGLPTGLLLDGGQPFPMQFPGPSPLLETVVRAMAFEATAGLLALSVEETPGSSRWWFYRITDAGFRLLGGLRVHGDVSRAGAFTPDGTRFVYSESCHLRVYEMEPLYILEAT